MEWLKTILANAVYVEGKIDIDATMKQINTEFAKHAVPKADFNDVKGQLKTANETITTLQKDNEGNEELQKTVKTHEETIKQLKLEHEKEVQTMLINSGITNVLSQNNAKHPDLLSGKFDLEKIVVKDGKVSGLEEQMKGLKETYKDLFEATVSGRTPQNPDGTNNTGSFDALVKQAGEMTAEEVAAQFAEMSKQQ